MDRDEALFAQEMRDMAALEGSRLLKDERSWRKRVPESTDRAVMAALGLTAAAAAGMAGKAGKRSAALTARGVGKLGALKAAVLAVAAAAVLSAGTIAAVPPLRNAVAERFTSYTQSLSSPAAQQKNPGDYAVPSPGADFVLTDGAENERLVYRWYTLDRQEVLVQIARRLPEDELDGSPGETVMVGGTVGIYRASGERQVLLLQDGDVWIRIVFFARSRDALLDYAARLAAENGIS